MADDLGCCMAVNVHEACAAMPLDESVQMLCPALP